MYSDKIYRICKAVNTFYGQKTWYIDFNKPSMRYYKNIDDIYIHTPFNDYNISWNYFKNNGNYITIFNMNTMQTYKFRIQHKYKDILKALCYVFKLCEFEYNIKNPMHGYSGCNIR